MSRTTGTARPLLTWMIFVALLSGCQSVPATKISISPTSSLLAVDVLFPIPLGRDPSLVQVFFMKGPIHDGLEELPELIPATFVKWSRAYLLDPDPGSYSVVAVTAEYAPPWNFQPIAGVTQTVASGTSSDAMIFPAELIHRTTTRVAAGDVAFSGALRVGRGDHINAQAVPQDDLQKRIAERLRPGVTSESGLSGWLKRTRTVDLARTSLSNQPADRESFLAAALVDLGDSPWAAVIAREAPPAETRVVATKTPAPGRARPATRAVKSGADSAVQSRPISTAAAAKPLPPIVDPRVAPVEVESTAGEATTAPSEMKTTATEASSEPSEVVSAAVEATAAFPEPEPPPLAPELQPFPGVPPDSLLAKIERGMRHDEVQAILGSPDGRIDRLTAKAWNPFYNGPDANLRDWIYAGKGRVVFSLYQGSLEVIDVIYDPEQRK